MEQTQEQTAHTYEIGGVRYRLEPLSWQQSKWLGEHIFKGLDVATIDYATIHDCGREQGPLMMAICLLADGQSRVEQASLAFGQIQALAARWRGELSGLEVAKFCTHFFFSCRPDQMLMLMSGAQLQQQLIELEQSLAPGAGGSRTVSSPLPVETSPSSGPSAPSLDRMTPVLISSGA